MMTDANVIGPKSANPRAGDASAPRRESGDDRRAAIAAAARALIVEKGFEGLRTRDIADRVGINIATLHYHVPTKEALIGLVCEAMKRDFREQSMNRPRFHLPPTEQLEHEFDDFLELLAERQELLAVMNELVERSRRDPAIKVAIKPILGQWRNMLAAILAAGRDDGSFRPDLDPEQAAKIITSALIGFCRSPDPSTDSFASYRAELLRAVRNPFASNQDQVSK